MGNIDFTYPPTAQEIRDLVKEVEQSDYFSLALQHVFPGTTAAQMRETLAGVTDVDTFQRVFMIPFCQWIVDNTITEFSHTGWISPAQDASGQSPAPAVYVSKHRDIIIDALLLQYLRITGGTVATNDVIGSNLFEMPIMTVAARLNKMVPIGRGGSPREFYASLTSLSAWIRRRVGEGESVWIAQRNGRTKDGIDRTDEAVVKMLAMSGQAMPGDIKGSRIKALAELNLVPMSISYEWEPCGIEKARELALKQLNGTYQKAPGEDSRSIVDGILSFKGRVHLALGSALTRADIEAVGGDTVGVAHLLDARIAEGYRLWPNNYVAADILDGTDARSDHYTPEHRAAFQAYLDKACAANPIEGFREILLGIYANPVLTH